jgi:hypothetical protein
MKRRSIELAAMCLFLATPAVAKPPITWVDGPVFPKTGPPPARTAFVVHGPVDVSDLRHDFVSAFAGDSAAGQAYLATALSECLSGVRLLGEPPHGIQRDERHRLGWTAFPLAAPPDTATWRIVWTDSLKVTSLRLEGADSLSSALPRAGADWLIVIDGLVATLEPGRPGMNHFTPSGEMLTEGGQPPRATLTARVVVLGAHPGAIVGYGRVSAWFDTGRFRKTSVDDMARWFALELERTLKKR